MVKKINRRNFIKSSALVGASTAIFPSKTIGKATANKKLRLGVIGTGLRGQWMIHLSLLRKDVDIKAICDVFNYRNGKTAKKKTSNLWIAYCKFMVYHQTRSSRHVDNPSQTF